MTRTFQLPSRWWLPFVVLLVLIGAGRVVVFPHSPEGWSQLSLLRSRDLAGCLLPFPEYTYYRPLWFAYLKLCDLLGLDGGPSHAGVVALHAGGVLLLYRVLRRLGQRPADACVGAALLGIAPGTAAALSWLAAGNKVFTFFFLALGAVFVTHARRWGGVLAGFVLGGVPAILCSENAYGGVLLLPCLALLHPSRDARFRWRAAIVLGAFLLLASIVHLGVLSPQAGAGRHGQTAVVLASLWADPIGWCRDAAGNCGRYLLHGVGVADDAPIAGLVSLAVLTLLGVLTRRGAGAGLLLLLVAFVLLNVPAALVPGQSARHQAYLPALGAGLIAAWLARWTPARGALVPALGLWFLIQGWAGQNLWSAYLGQAERARRSGLEALPALPSEGSVVLVNVPHEYRAAFHLRFGPSAKVLDWPAFTILSTRRSILLPAGFRLPEGAGDVVLEYDGWKIRRSSFAELAARERAPPAWFVDRIRAFETPALAWGEILARTSRLSELGLGFRAGDREARGAGKRTVRVLRHGQHPCLHWELEAELETTGWLVLGWFPLHVPATESAWIFPLHPLPWLFRIVVRDLDRPARTLPVPAQPVLGLLPAIWLETGRHRLRVELLPRV